MDDVFLWMQIQSDRVLESETGSLAIITNLWDYRLENSKNCFNAHGFREVTDQAGRSLSPIR